MPENLSKKSLPWSEEHEAFCYKHHICPAAKTLWQWLMRQGEIATEIEPHLVKEFNAWVAKIRGKGYSAKHLKDIFNQLVESRVIQVIKRFSWSEFRLIVRPLQWLNPPKKRQEKKSENCNLTFTSHPSNDKSTVPVDIQQQHSDINLETLAEAGIHYDSSEKEVLERPTNEIKLGLLMFNLRGGLDKILNPEGFIRRCLRERWWDFPRNYNLLLSMFGNSTEWDELFPSG